MRIPFKSRHLYFETIEELDDTYAVGNKHTRIRLGEIVYSIEWRTYIFNPLEDTFYDAACLYDIQLFLMQLNAMKVRKDVGVV